MPTAATTDVRSWRGPERPGGPDVEAVLLPAVLVVGIGAALVATGIAPLSAVAVGAALGLGTPGPALRRLVGAALGGGATLLVLAALGWLSPPAVVPALLILAVLSGGALLGPVTSEGWVAGWTVPLGGVVVLVLTDGRSPDLPSVLSAAAVVLGGAGPAVLGEAVVAGRDAPVRGTGRPGASPDDDATDGA
ncbi:hypothetical protein GCM10011354_05220 [Egicoccus halophilus]|uniref:Uncharacterized protein n=1 Tax=Egicoccus halophilus TaxID=1670830 RepID=A0A8J3ETC9_9ACTN|nr:hypothetical protein GCM10011354_05220 [Egicoccus halophilus]